MWWSACCRLFLTQINGNNDKILSFCIVLRAIPNFRSVAQVSAHRGRDWRLRTTLLCEPLNVIIGWVMHKAHNLLNMSQPPNDSMLATYSDNHYTLSAVVQIHGWMSLLVGSETTFMKFNTAYCGRALWSYSSFPLDWLKLFPKCLSQGINAIMILLMCQNQL